MIDASKDLGAGRFRTFWNVTLPLVRPGLATDILLTFVPMTGEFVIPQILGGDRGVLMGGLIATQYLYAQNLALGSAMAVLLLVVLGIAVVALMRLTRGFAEVRLESALANDGSLVRPAPAGVGRRRSAVSPGAHRHGRGLFVQQRLTRKADLHIHAFHDTVVLSRVVRQCAATLCQRQL